MIPSTRAPERGRRFSDCFLPWHVVYCENSPCLVWEWSVEVTGGCWAACCVKWIRYDRRNAGGREVKGHHGSRWSGDKCGKVGLRPDFLHEIALNLEKRMTNQGKQFCTAGEPDEALTFGYYDEDDDDLDAFPEDGLCGCDEGGQPYFYTSHDLVKVLQGHFVYSRTLL